MLITNSGSLPCVAALRHPLCPVRRMEQGATLNTACFVFKMWMERLHMSSTCFQCFGLSSCSVVRIGNDAQVTPLIVRTLACHLTLTSTLNLNQQGGQTNFPVQRLGKALVTQSPVGVLC